MASEVTVVAFGLLPLPPFCFSVGRATLRDRSAYFGLLLAASPGAPLLLLPPSISPAAFKTLLDYLETGELRLTAHNSLEVVAAAAELGVAISQPTSPRNGTRSEPERVVPSQGPSPSPPHQDIKAESENDCERASSPHLYIPDFTRDDSISKTGADGKLDRAVCDGPIRFAKIGNAFFNAGAMRRNSEEKGRFFPCRECGRKFPSYYFVHKHRQSCSQQSVALRPSSPPAHSH